MPENIQSNIIEELISLSNKIAEEEDYLRSYLYFLREEISVQIAIKNINKESEINE